MIVPRPSRPGAVFGANLPNAVADVGAEPPEGWETRLREVSPINTIHSHLRFYWYRAGQRWVLYDCVPSCLIHDDEAQGAPIMGAELRQALDGPPPRELPDGNACPYVSDVQHEFWRRWQVYARPFWVLQGDRGGHQVRFSPWQQNVLLAKGLPNEPPAIGSLPFAPFDERAVVQLSHLNRLHQMEDSLERFKGSGTRESADAEMEQIQKEIRLAESTFIESQMTPVIDMAQSLIRGPGSRSEYERELIRVPDGAAAKASEAYDRYLETGDFTV